MKIKTLTAGAAALALLAGVTSSCSGGQEQQQGQQAPQIQVLTLTPETSELANSYPAIIKGKTDIAIRPQVSGFITKVCVDEGERVHKGQTLFILDQVTFQAAVEQAREQVNSAKAAVASAQAAVNTAQSNERNQRMLFDKGIISQTQWQNAADQLAQAKAALGQANAGVASAKAALSSAEKNLSYTVVTAPSDGVVGTIPAREGSLASPSSAQPLTTVSDINQVYAYFSLTEKDLLDLTDKGARTLDQALEAMPAVQLRLANGTMYPLTGKVATVSGVIDNATGAASVRALFDNTNGMLRSGSTGAVVMPHNTANAIVIPQKATYELQDKRYVYTVNDSNMTVSTPIEVLDINDGQTFVVTQGLKAGDRIVIEGVGTTVRDGMPIQPVDPATAQAADAAAQQAAAK